jgi:hypothetical protein
MKRNLALFLAMAGAAFAQTPTVSQKPAPKPSSQTVKVAPVIAVQSAKPSPNSLKVATTPAPKPAVVAVKAAATHSSTAGPVKATPAAKPVVIAAPAKAVAVVPPAKAAAGSTKEENKANASAAGSKLNSSTVRSVPAVAAKNSVKAPGKTQTGNAQLKTAVAVQDSKTGSDKKQPAKTINAVGRRDPFVSPVVNLGAVGSGCSSGKRCLAIDQIALKGVVRSETGMIAVVVNAMDKAYFLRENDPVFNGYVTKITGDSIVFKETFKDKLGKPLTRDITKTISRPVA